MARESHRDVRASGRPSQAARVWMALALLHLVLVVAGATHFYFWDYGKIGRALDRYGLLSGAASSYPFFAPEVGTSIRARFELYDPSGKRIATDDLAHGATREADLRLSNIVEMIDEDLTDDRTRHLLAASWAGKIFARHPHATRLKLSVETYDLPTMSEYRAGLRYDWEPIYTAEFGRKPRGTYVGSR